MEDNVVLMPQTGLTENDLMNLFMGLFRLITREKDEEIKKLRKELKTLYNKMC